MVRLESGLAEENEVVDVLVRYGPVNNPLSHLRIYMFAYLSVHFMLSTCICLDMYCIRSPVAP